jgi:hypothetical protein
MKFIRETQKQYGLELLQSTLFHGDAEKLLDRFPSDFLRDQLDKALVESTRLKAENERLRRMLGILDGKTSTLNNSLSEPSQPFTQTDIKLTNDSTTKDKVSLFRSLFRGREDAYPLRWERKEHLEYLQERLKNFARNIYCPEGWFGEKTKTNHFRKTQKHPGWRRAAHLGYRTLCRRRL